jgi:hypothetical protein
VKEDKSISPRTKRLLEHFEEIWKMPHEISLEDLKRIITSLPDVHQFMGIEAVAQHLVSIMKLHFLDIVATFYEKSEEEGINTSERDEIVNDAMTESLQGIQQIERQLAVHSIHDLVLLANITFGLYALSQVESAETSERWIYNIPRMYRERLDQEHLVAEPIRITAMMFIKPTKLADSWNAALANQTWNYQEKELIQVQPGIGGISFSLVA